VSVALPGACRFKSDCLSAVQAVHNGLEKSTAASKIYARVYNLLLAALDDTPCDRVIWVPAHKGEESVGAMRCGNGERFTLADLRGNDAADMLAKQAVLQHRVSPAEVHRWKQVFSEVKTRAKWIAAVTVAAAGVDSEAARWRSDEAAAERRKAKKLRRASECSTVQKPKFKIFARPSACGGHVLGQEDSTSRKGWKCSVCKRCSASWRAIAGEKCRGSAAVRWAEKAQLLAERGISIGGGHSRLLSGDVMWCGTCGCYADGKAVGLAAPCAGPPAKLGHGGMWGQLRKLRNGRHPRTGVTLPPPVREHGAEQSVAALPVPGLAPAGGRSANLKAQEMRARIRAKESAARGH
jgi:hypothetical protein